MLVGCMLSEKKANIGMTNIEDCVSINELKDKEKEDYWKQLKPDSPPNLNQRNSRTELKR